MTVIVMSNMTMLPIMVTGMCLMMLGDLHSEQNRLRVDSLTLLFDVEAQVPR